MDEQRMIAYINLLESLLNCPDGEEVSLITPQDYLDFLKSVLEAVATDNSPQLIYPLLQKNLDKLDDNFAQILTAWTNKDLTEVEIKNAKFIATNIFYFSNLIQEFTLGNIASNKEIAIAGYQAVATVFTQSDFPEQWAGTQNNLAAAYSDRIRGDRAENLEAAIAHYHNALLVCTQSDFPEQWAMTEYPVVSRGLSQRPVSDFLLQFS